MGKTISTVVVIGSTFLIFLIELSGGKGVRDWGWGPHAIAPVRSPFELCCQVGSAMVLNTGEIDMNQCRTTATIGNGIVVGVLAIALAGCGGASEPAATSTVTATSRVTVTYSSTQPSASAPMAPAASSPPDTAPAASAPADSWIMPSEIGKNLQRAQDDLQALTGNPMFVSTSEDLTGMGRQQIMDRNWQVCSSNPAPGSAFTSQTNVVFGVVRDSETCP